jgi:hypothetical protein
MAYLGGDAVAIADTVTVSGSATTSVLLRRVSKADGTVAWSKSISSIPGVSERAVGAAGLNGGDIVVATTASTTDGIKHTFVYRLSLFTGATLASTDIPNFTAVGVSGVAVFGTANGTFTYGGAAGKITTSGDDAVFLGLDLNLSTISAVRFGSSGNDRAIALGRTPDDEGMQVLGSTPTGAFAAAVQADGTVSWNQSLSGHNFSNGSIAGDDRWGVAVSAADGIQFLNARTGAAQSFYAVPAGVTIDALVVGDEGFVAAGTTTVKVTATGTAPIGSNDAFVLGFDGANQPGWDHILGTTADERGTAVDWTGGRFTLVGTTTGALSGAADANGDVFFSTYNEPKIDKFPASATIADDHISVSVSWTTPTYTMYAASSYTVKLYPSLDGDTGTLISSLTVQDPATSATLALASRLAPGDYIVKVTASNSFTSSTTSIYKTIS